MKFFNYYVCVVPLVFGAGEDNCQLKNPLVSEVFGLKEFFDEVSASEDLSVDEKGKFCTIIDTMNAADNTSILTEKFHELKEEFSGYTLAGKEKKSRDEIQKLCDYQVPDNVRIWSNILSFPFEDLLILGDIETEKLCKAIKDAVGNGDDPSVEQIIDAIDTRKLLKEKELKLKTVIDVCGVSVEYLCQTFDRAQGEEMYPKFEAIAKRRLNDGEKDEFCKLAIGGIYMTTENKLLILELKINARLNEWENWPSDRDIEKQCAKAGFFEIFFTNNPKWFHETIVSAKTPEQVKNLCNYFYKYKWWDGQYLVERNGFETSARKLATQYEQINSAITVAEERVQEPSAPTKIEKMESSSAPPNTIANNQQVQGEMISTSEEEMKDSFPTHVVIQEHIVQPSSTDPVSSTPPAKKKNFDLGLTNSFNNAMHQLRTSLGWKSKPTSDTNHPQPDHSPSLTERFNSIIAGLRSPRK